MTAGPAVSVILNCYNHQDYVSEAIESVLRQTHRDLELIIIDNGSTDGTRKVIESFTDERIRPFLHDDNRTVSRRLNEGVAAARGEFVTILYSDDWFLPRKLERQLGIFATLPPDYGVIYGPAIGFNQITGVRWQRPSLGVSGPMMPAMFDRFFDGSIDMSTPLTRRVCFEQYPFYDELFSDGEYVFFRIAISWKFHFDPEPFVVLRDHGENMSKATHKNHDMMMAMLDRMEARPDFREEWRPNLRHLRALAYRNHTWMALRMDHDDDAWVWQQFRRSLVAEPTQLLRPKMLAAMALALLPGGARATLNRLVNDRRPRPESTKMKQSQ